MDIESQQISQIESILFVHGDPIKKKRLSGILGCGEDILEVAIFSLKKRYEETSSGLSLIEKDDTLTLVSKSKNSTLVRKVLAKDVDTPLSPSLMEVMTIIAYQAPIHRHDVDHIRGVNSSFALRNLLVRGLIERFEDPDRMGAYLYRPTVLFLEQSGITSLDTLPDYESLHRNIRLSQTTRNEKT